MKKIVLTGGGTGGHIYPLLAVAEELRKSFEGTGEVLELHYVGSANEFEKELNIAGIKIHKILSGKLRRYFSLANFFDAPKVFIGLIQSFFRIYFIMPDACFSKGGPGALPVILASKFYAVPIIIHESDAYPGLTNLLSARFAEKIAISFDSVASYFPASKIIMTGNPVRTLLLRDKLPPEPAKEMLGFNIKLPLILVLGGSQGSQRINEFTLSILGELAREAQILHQTGTANHALIQKVSESVLAAAGLSEEEKKRYKAVPYLVQKEMACALSAADLIIGRAGSGTIFEIAAFGKPSVIIPLPEAAGDHQRENAYSYAKTGAALVIEEDNLSAQLFLTQIRRLMAGADNLKLMGVSADNFAKPEAAGKIADIISKLA